MAQLTRILQKIFGGGSSQNGQFGSAQLGTPTLSNDPSVIQGLPAWEQGWNSATISGDKLPALEEVQGVDYVVTRQLSYLFQAGIPEWIATETYYEGSIARDATGAIYKSLQDNNLNHALTDLAWWDSAVAGGVPDGVYGDITVSVGGTVWTVNNSAIDENKLATDSVTTNKVLDKNITFAKVQDVATRTLSGRTTAGTGSLEQVPFIDDDTMATATDSNVPSAESVKAYVDGKVVYRTPQTTTSGTSREFLSIPTGVRQIVVMFAGVSLSGSSDIMVQLGTSGGYETTGYLSATSLNNVEANYTNGFAIRLTANGNIAHGNLVVNLMDDSLNIWCCSSAYALSNGSFTGYGGGSKTMPSVVDRIRIVSANGTDTLDAGTVNIFYR